MMPFSETRNELLFHSQVLRAKIAIRDHYLNNIVREIYENSGQILTLVRLQLANLKSQTQDTISNQIAASGELVGEVIRNWKEMSKNFAPEAAITSEAGIVEALHHELNREKGLESIPRITVKGIPFAIATDAGLIYFHLILDVSIAISGLYGRGSMNMEVNYSNLNLCVLITYLIEDSPQAKQRSSEAEELFRQLQLYERIKLIKGTVDIRRRYKRKGRIAISMPYSA